MGAEYQYTDRSQFYMGYQIDGDRTTTGIREGRVLCFRGESRGTRRLP